MLNYCLSTTLHIHIAVVKLEPRFLHLTLVWARLWENLFIPYANNKGTDQPALLRNLISAFVVRCLDSSIPLGSISEISSLYLASVAEQAGLSLHWSQTPKTGFLVTRLICLVLLYISRAGTWSHNSEGMFSHQMVQIWQIGSFVLHVRYWYFGVLF